MNRRGMTLLELLVALTLLSAVSAACVSWTTLAGRALTRDGGRFAWRSAAERTLDLVDRALLIEDAALGAGPWDAERVRCDHQAVEVRTRLVHEVEQEPAVCQTLRLCRERDVLVVEYIGATGDVVARRPLLGDVAALEVCAVELEHDTILLSLKICHESGESVERNWPLAERAPR